MLRGKDLSLFKQGQLQGGSANVHKKRALGYDLFKVRQRSQCQIGDKPLLRIGQNLYLQIHLQMNLIQHKIQIGRIL